jgi:hypothetical protein
MRNPQVISLGAIAVSCLASGALLAQESAVERRGNEVFRYW